MGIIIKPLGNKEHSKELHRYTLVKQTLCAQQRAFNSGSGEKKKNRRKKRKPQTHAQAPYQRFKRMTIKSCTISRSLAPQKTKIWQTS